MKKVLLLLLIFICFTGCSKCPTCEECSSESTKENIKEITYNQEELKSLLLQYGKFVYDEVDFKKMDTTTNVYYMTIKELYENNGYDITQFIKNNCKLDTTKIEVKVIDRETSNIEYNPVLDCNEK